MISKNLKTLENWEDHKLEKMKNLILPIKNHDVLKFWKKSNQCQLHQLNEF